jgi:hypothetical protein
MQAGLRLSLTIYQTRATTESRQNKSVECCETMSSTVRITIRTDQAMEITTIQQLWIHSRRDVFNYSWRWRNDNQST